MPVESTVVITVFQDMAIEVMANFQGTAGLKFQLVLNGRTYRRSAITEKNQKKKSFPFSFLFFYV
jgi:hypothetical protein